MIGVHAFWSKPTITGTNGHHLNGTQKFKMYNFEILHFLLSALQYRSLNGPIHLYTDPIFFEYLKENNYLHFWDKIDTSYYKKFKSLNIDSKSSWTSFKTWLVGQLETPFLILDHDNMVYTKIPESLFDIDVRFAHWETLDKSVYVPKDELEVENFLFDDAWNWNMNISNTCMLYFNNKKIASEYSKVALDFLSKHKPKSSIAMSNQYLFADQRLLGMLLDSSDYTYGTFSNSIYDIKTSQYYRITDFEVLDQVGFDHTWFHKHKLKDDSEKGESEDLKPYLDRHEQIVKDGYIKYYDSLKNLFYVD